MHYSHNAQKSMSEFNQNKYINNYMKQNYDTFKVQTPRGTKEPLKEYIKSQGYNSMNEYMAQLIKADLEKAMQSVDEQTRTHADLALYNILKKEQTERKETVDYIVDLGDGNTIIVEKENRPE